MDSEIILCKVIPDGITPSGNKKEKLIETEVFCSVESVKRTEFYMAKQASLKPELEFVVREEDYDGQEKVIYQNKKYEVIRAFEKDGYASLICTRSK